MTELVAPTGAEIKGTFELVPGTAGVSFTTEEASGYDHDGSGTDMCWDGAITKTIGDATVFSDENGEEWLLHHLVADEDEAGKIRNETIAAMRREMVIGETLGEMKELDKSLDLLRTRFNLDVRVPSDGVVGILHAELLSTRTLALALKKRDLEG